MAINIDTVYQKVLAIANKEQRGYINPQQFNLFANQAQLDIFEDYFYKLGTIEFSQKNDTQYADLKHILLEKIEPFEKTDSLSYVVDGVSRFASFSPPSDVYRLGSVKYLDQGTNLVNDTNFSEPSTSELLTNGSFTGNANGWVNHNGSAIQSSASKNFYYSSNGIKAGSGLYYKLRQDISIKPFKTYRLQFTVSDYVSGGVTVFLLTDGQGNNPQHIGFVNTGTQLGNGTHTFYITPSRERTQTATYTPWWWDRESGIRFSSQDSNGTRIAGTHQFVPGTEPNYTIDDISFKEVSRHWTITPYNSWQFGSGNLPDTPDYDPSSNRLRKAWATHANSSTSGQQLLAGYIQHSMVLAEGSTYAITYTIGNATNGRILLANHLAESVTENTIEDGTNDNLQLFGAGSYGDDTPGTYTRYWTQGGTNLDKLSIWHDKYFDGFITDIAVRLVSGSNDGVNVEQVRGHELTRMLKSQLMSPTTTRPVYVAGENGLTVYPSSITDGLTCYYIRKIRDVNWGYTEVNSTALYNSSLSTDFELHESEENTLIIKILSLAGISVKDAELMQVAMAKEQQTK
tara:strand:- start:90 stop:1805 length:1716 start_codon:yes stop_codon:yes gene_type:complete